MRLTRLVVAGALVAGPVLLARASSLAAQGTTTRPAPRPSAARSADTALSAPLGIDPNVRAGRLPNGLSWFVRRNSRPEKRAELRLVVRTGSVLEDDDQRGLAHFVEHMAFNGTRRFEKNELVTYLERVGMRFGPDINASTSFDETIYMLQIPTDSAAIVRTAFEILEDWSRAITFDSAEVNKERGVVIEEWRLGRGAGARIFDRQIPILLKGSRYAERLPIGTVETLREAPVSALTRFYRDWYRPDLMAVIAVGDFDPAAMERRIREHFSTLRAPARVRPRPRFGVPDQGTPLVTIASDPEATNTVVSAYFKRPRTEVRTLGAYREQIVHGLFGQMFNDRLEEISQKPDAPFIAASGGIGGYFGDRDAFSLSALVKDGGAVPGLDAVMTEVERVQRHGFVAPELERAKQNLLRAYERAYAERERTESSDLADELVRHFTEAEAIPGIAREWTLQQRFVPGVTLAEVNALVRQWISDRDVVVALSAPQRDSVPLPSERDLLAVLASVNARQVDPYVETAASATIAERPATPGRVVTRDSIPEIGVTRWTLSNGVRVILKPTTFKADQVLMSAWSPGGSSLLPDSLWSRAREATLLVGEGGVGSLSRIDLQKALAGKAVSVGPSIGELTEGMSGSASPKDLPTLFELTYAYFTAPRADSSAVLSLRQRFRAFFVNRGASPEAAFSDTLGVTLTSHHPRTTPVSSETIDSLDLAASMRFYRDRFADAGDFTFVFVGNVSPQELEPLAVTWLGALPTTGRKEEGRDIGVRRPTGVVRREVRRGTEPKSLTQMIFSGPFEWTRENRYAIASLEEVLRMRLRDVLREELSGTYGVQVSASPQRQPRPQFDLSIGYGSSPEKATSLEQAVFAQIDSIQRTGPTAGELEKVREIQRRSEETNLKENGYWLSALVSYDREGVDPGRILRGEELRALLTADLVRDAARKYLDRQNYVLVRLLPEQSSTRP